MKNKLIKYLFLFTIIFCIVSCNRVKTTPRVVASYADGKPRILTEYVTDKNGNEKLYKEIHFFAGEQKHMELKYDDNGLRNGVCASWYENGNKFSEVKYVHGKEDGKYCTWHSNGQPFIKGKYDMGIKVGVWEFCDTLGVKTREEFYDKSGVKIREEKY